MRFARTMGAAVLCAAVAVTAASAAKQERAATDAVKAIADSYVKASLAGDAKAIAALYTEDAVEMPPNQPVVKGRTAIQQHYEKLFASDMKMTRFTLTHLEAHVLGDRAYDVGTYDQVISTKDAASPMKDTGKYTVILKRSAGAWKVAYAIYNSDHPSKQ